METVVPLVMMLVEEAIKVEPAVATELASLFANGAPTAADWQAYRTKNTADTFESLAPNAAANLPETAPAPALAVTAQDETATATEETAAPAPALALHPIFGTPITAQ